MSRTDILKRAWIVDPDNMGLFEQLKMAIVREGRDDLPVFSLKRDKFHAAKKVVLDENFEIRDSQDLFRVMIIRNYYGEYFAFIKNHKDLKKAKDGFSSYLPYHSEELVFGDYTLYEAYDVDSNNEDYDVSYAKKRNYLYESKKLSNANTIREIRRLFKAGYNVPINKIVVKEIKKFKDAWAIKRKGEKRFRRFGYSMLRNPDLTWREAVAQTYGSYLSSISYYVLRSFDGMQWDKFDSNFDLGDFRMAGKIHSDAGEAIENFIPLLPAPNFGYDATDYYDDEDDGEDYGDGGF